jgi:signal transduction histidine kinase
MLFAQDPNEAVMNPGTMDESQKPLLDQERARFAAELRDGEHQRDQWLAMLAHELRGPLAAVSNAIRLLERPDLGPAEAAWCREVAGRQVRHLAHLLDDLLDISRVRLGKIQLKREGVDLHAAIGRVLTPAGPRIAAHRLRMETRLPAEAVVVSADSHRLEQVISNLVHNALKFTPDGGRIVLTVARDGPEAIVTVRDEGIGIAPDLLPRIFEPFIQAESTIDRPEGGLGLGLSLVRSLCEMHGGRVSACSDGPGTGSLFELRWPLLSPHPTSPEGI